MQRAPKHTNQYVDMTYPTQAQMKAVQTNPNYYQMPKMLKELHLAKYNASYSQLDTIALTLNPKNYNSVMEMAFDQAHYSFGKDKKGRIAVKTGKPIKCVWELLCRIAKNFNSQQISRCTDFLLLMDHDMLSDFVDLFVKMPTALAVPIYGAFMRDDKKPSNLKHILAHILRNIVLYNPSFEPLCSKEMLDAISEPYIRLMCPETVGIVVQKVQQCHKVWKACELAIVRNAYAEKLIRYDSCPYYDLFLFFVGGEALLLNNESDPLVRKTASTGKFSVLEQESEKNNAEHEAVEHFKQGFAHFNKNEFEEAIMSLLDANFLSYDTRVYYKAYHQTIICYMQLGRYEDAFRAHCFTATPDFNLLQTILLQIKPQPSFPQIVVPVASMKAKFCAKQYLINETMLDEADKSFRYCCLDYFPQVVCVRADNTIVVWHCNKKIGQLLITYDRREHNCSSIAVYNGQINAYDALNHGVASYPLPDEHDNKQIEIEPTKSTFSVPSFGSICSSGTCLYVDDTWLFVSTCYYTCVAMNRKTGVNRVFYTVSQANDILVGTYHGIPVAFVACEDSGIRVFSLQEWNAKKTRVLYMFALIRRGDETASGKTSIHKLGSKYLISRHSPKQSDDPPEFYFVHVWDIDSRTIVYCLKFATDVSDISVHEESGSLCTGHDDGSINVFTGFKEKFAPVHLGTIQACRQEVQSVHWLEKDVVVVASITCRSVTRIILRAPTKQLKGACLNCNVWNARNLRCSKCQLVHYCDAECQRADWPKHKLVCKKV